MYLSTVNVVKIGSMPVEVLGTDVVSDERLLDMRFLRITVISYVFIVLKKRISASSVDGREIEVTLKYERLLNFCFSWGRFAHKREVCHVKSLDTFSNDLQAMDFSDKHASFLSIHEIYSRAKEDDNMNKDSIEGFPPLGGQERSRDYHKQNPGQYFDARMSDEAIRLSESNLMEVEVHYVANLNVKVKKVGHIMLATQP
ncbi:hypothetical protein Ancab_035805 [Ancistrocladus abbreviatus]